MGLAGPLGILGGAALAVAGAGIGLGFGPVLTLVTQRVPSSQVGDASGTLTTIAQLGYLTGVATRGSWFVSTAQLPASTPAFHAFTGITVAMSALALAASALAARLIIAHSRTTPPAVARSNPP